MRYGEINQEAINRTLLRIGQNNMKEVCELILMLNDDIEQLKQRINQLEKGSKV